MLRIPALFATLVAAMLPPPIPPPPAPPPVPEMGLCAGPIACGADVASATEPPAMPEIPPIPPIPPIPDLEFPADLLDLSDWYLTLPTGKDGDPDDVYPPDLGSFDGSWFQLNNSADGVVFRANAGGVTTENSKYPRSELREMTGGELASWSNETGTHTLDVRQAVTQLPKAKPHVVTAQIHGGDDDVVLVRLEGERLMAEYDDGDSEIVIDPKYRLGTPYDLRITAAERRIEIFYNDELAAEIPRSGSGWYFKTGAYLQSNPERGDTANAAGEVVLYSLQVQHVE